MLPFSSYRRRTWLVLLLMVSGSSCLQAADISPEETLARYLVAAGTGDQTSAAAFWLAGDLDRSQRLGVTYEGVPLKLDCANPFHAIPDLRGTRFEVLASDGSGRLRHLTVGWQSGGERVTATYHLAFQAGSWRLVDPTTAVGASWPVTTSRFLRFHVQPGRYLGGTARAALDSFVDKTCERLGLPPGEIRKLTTEKIDYYFCDPASVEKIAGAPTRGVAMLPVDAVVTSEPVHQHELAHLLVNYALGDLPLYTLPVLQEGIAVHLGGRWGRAPRVMAGLGRFVLGSGFVEVEDLLTWEGFRRDLPDLTYAPAGVLAGFLLHHLGPAGFLTLYEDLSGDPDFLIRLSGLQVRQALESRLGLAPGDLEAALGVFADGIPRAGFAEADPELQSDVVILEAPGRTATLHESGAWIGFDIQVQAGAAEGVMTLVPANPSPDRAIPAGRLFGEIRPGAVYEGERAALVFKPGEAGLYDFGTDLLTAKNVEDFRPLPGFFDESAQRWRFRIRRDLFPEALETHEWRLLPPGPGRE